jgi:hypothetical protein
MAKMDREVHSARSQQERILAAEIDESNGQISQECAVRTQAKFCRHLAQGSIPFARSLFQGLRSYVSYIIISGMYSLVNSIHLICNGLLPESGHVIIAFILLLPASLSDPH